MGDPTRARLAASIIKVIRDENLLESTAQVGDKLYSSLKSLAAGPAQGKLHGLRGKGAGTMIAFDCATPEKRDQFLGTMRRHGVNMGAHGFFFLVRADIEGSGLWRQGGPAASHARLSRQACRHPA